MSIGDWTRAGWSFAIQVGLSPMKMVANVALENDEYIGSHGIENRQRNKIGRFAAVAFALFKHGEQIP
jgi:hypothetical protein